MMSSRSRSKSHNEDSENIGQPEVGAFNKYEAGEDEGIDEEKEITRCICGREEINNQRINPKLQKLLLDKYGIKIDQGLFIQCDDCSVWQHGYCVGLFTNEDVPDKYLCEICNPELHLVVEEDGERKRSLYKPVNVRRKELLVETEEYNEKKKNKPSRTSNNSTTPPPDYGKYLRRERRLLEDSQDEQLRKALQESAKESGLLEDKKPNKSKRNKNESPAESNKKTKQEKDDNSNPESANNDSGNTSGGNGNSKSKKILSRSGKPKSQKPNSGGQSREQPTREEMLNQRSKPRYVNEKSSIYELRKRIGAILEWLGRSQVELEEDNLSKLEIFKYGDKLEEGGNKIVDGYNQNIKSMEKLTEVILQWEQKYGKYAP